MNDASRKKNENINIDINYMASYSFGVPLIAIWLIHILIGIYFCWLGYNLSDIKYYKIHGIVLIVLGALMVSYHSHLWFNYLRG